MYKPATNTEAIQNSRYQLDSQLYNNNGDRDQHFYKFMNFLAQMASLDEEFSERDQTSRLSRPLQE